MLYHKYRPQKFEEMVGNKEEILSLKNVFSKPVEEIPHCFLFAGESGCGKTTSARICASILKANKENIIEINSANNRGIDTARWIIDLCQSKPLGGGVFVFIIDEVQKTTNDFQNALLKIFEDTPDWVYFFLCTTEKNKIIQPLQKRCMIFNFKPVEFQVLYRYLKYISKKEGKEIEEEILEEIVRKSQGGIRQALIYLEKVFEVEGLEQRKNLLRNIGDFIEDISEDKVIDLCRFIFSGKRLNWKEITEILSELKTSYGDDVFGIKKVFLAYGSSMLLNKEKPEEYVIKLIEFLGQDWERYGFSGLVFVLASIYNTK